MDIAKLAYLRLRSVNGWREKSYGARSVRIGQETKHIARGVSDCTIMSEIGAVMDDATQGRANSSVKRNAASTLHVAYLINQYPKVSHSFIRREILALERLGVRVDRISIRGWDAEVVDPADLAELDKVRFVLRKGVMPLLLATAQVAASAPRRFMAALSTALSMSQESKPSLPYRFIYLAEACCVHLWLGESGAGHLHAHFGTNSAAIAMLVHALGGLPYSFTVHGMNEIDQGASLSLDRKVASAKFAVAVSLFNRSQLFRRVAPEYWSRIRIVHCGLDKAFHDVPAAPLPQSADFVCVGRLSEEKGQLVLIEALRSVCDRGHDCRLVLVGDGPMRERIEDRVRALGLTQRVRITGFISSQEVRDEILAARALVLPSFMEGLPVVLMEAMALRRPVIASNIAGIPELVRHNEDGWLVAAGSPSLLADAMIECLAASPKKLADMTDRAQARVLERHDIDREAAKLRDFFEKAADTGRIEQ